MTYSVLLDKAAARFLLQIRDAKLKSRLDEAFFVLLAGKVALASASSQNPVAHLSEGDFLGEMVLLAGEPSTFTGTVEETATVLRIEASAINQLVQTLPRFALEISQFIDDRRKLTRAV